MESMALPVRGLAQVVEVSPEMIAVIGPGDLPPACDFPPGAVMLGLKLAAAAAATVSMPAPARRAEVRRALSGDSRIVLVVARKALRRLGGDALLAASGERHATTALRTIATSLLAAEVPLGAQESYRLAKAIELLCEVVRAELAGELLPGHAGGISAADTRRLLQARGIIDERCGEKLTLNAISRACGLNRSKLTRGFRELFQCTVGEALAARRLEAAGRLLLTTDLPVSIVGLEAGYLNNASFTRAFGRRYGRTPTDFRAGGLAA